MSKELKTWSSNEFFWEKVNLICDEVIARLKMIDDHVFRNVLKRP
jgi:hypothetical protein